MPAYSHSKISTFETCRLQYKFSYIDRIKVEKETTVEAFLGSMIHESLEKLYKDLRYEKRLFQDDVIDYYNQIWEKNWSDSVLIVQQDYSEENYRRMGEKYLRNYYDRHAPFDEGTILGLETQELMPLDPDGRYKYHIRIDRLMHKGGGLYEVHDYKTGMSLPKQGELDQDRQLAMYGLWVCNRFKECEKIRLVWHYLAFGKEMESYRTREQLEELRRDVLSSINRIESAEDFPPKVNPVCQWCLFRDICPAWKHEKKLQQLPQNEYLQDPGVKLVDEYVRLKEDSDKNRKDTEEKLDKLKEALIAFCRKEDVTVVTGSEKKVTLNEYESLSLPGKNTPERTALIDLLKKTGRIEEVMDLDIHSLTKVIKNREWDEEMLNRLASFETKEKKIKLSVSKK